MKIKISTANSPEKTKSFQILGNEAWLDRLYSYYPSSKEESTQLEACFDFTQKETFCFIKGSLTFKNEANCKHCWELISPPHFKKEFSLSYDIERDVLKDLNDDFNYENENLLQEQELNLEAFFYDLILLERPSDLSPQAFLGSQKLSCSNCLKEDKQTKSLNPKKDKTSSSHPAFEKLKGWR